MKKVGEWCRGYGEDDLEVAWAWLRVDWGRRRTGGEDLGVHLALLLLPILLGLGESCLAVLVDLGVLLLPGLGRGWRSCRSCRTSSSGSWVPCPRRSGARRRRRV